VQALLRMVDLRVKGWRPSTPAMWADRVRWKAFSGCRGGSFREAIHSSKHPREITSAALMWGSAVSERRMNLRKTLSEVMSETLSSSSAIRYPSCVLTLRFARYFRGPQSTVDITNLCCPS
jgi:hypothetical protein